MEKRGEATTCAPADTNFESPPAPQANARGGAVPRAPVPRPGRFALGLAWQRSEFGRRLAVSRRCLVRRRDPEDQRLIERPADEIDADG